MTRYVDTHCHLDLLTDPAAALDAASDTVVVAVTELPSRYRLLESRFRDDRRARVALGLHPLRAGTAGPIEEGLLIRQLPDCDYVGEVGLDFSPHGRDTKRAQLRVFERLLAEPELRNKVVTIHSRGAERDVIDRLRQAGIRAVLHWYTGPATLVDEALAAGMYFSFNPPMLTSAKGRALLAAVPADRVLTETDAPFAKTRGRPLEPVDVRLAVAALARQWDTSVDDARTIVHDNLGRLFSISVLSRDNGEGGVPA
jgi:TatD DNase family protein